MASSRWPFWLIEGKRTGVTDIYVMSFTCVCQDELCPVWRPVVLISTLKTNSSPCCGYRWIYLLDQLHHWTSQVIILYCLGDSLTLRHVFLLKLWMTFLTLLHSPVPCFYLHGQTVEVHSSIFVSIFDDLWRIWILLQASLLSDLFSDCKIRFMMTECDTAL